MKDKTLKFYWSFFCVVLATFIAVVAMYVVFPNVDDTHSVPPVTECKIVLSEGDKYQAVSYITSVKKGTDATFELFFEEGYAFDGCDYMEYELLIGENSSLLMLKNILYPTSVEVYMEHSNKNVVKVFHIENREMAEQLETLCQIEGIDVLFIGPMDLSQSFGHPGDPSNPEEQEAIRNIIQTAAKYGVPTGIFVGTKEAAQKYEDMGVRYIAIGSDIAFMMSGAKNMIK